MKDHKPFIDMRDVLKAFLLVFTSFLVVYTSSQETATRPERCVGGADLLYRFCCVQPPFFTREVAKECGIAFELLLSDRENNVTGLRRQAFSRCGHWYCILDKYALITNEDRLDHEKFYAHLDLWTTLNPAFSDVMVDARRFCIQNFRFYFPLKPCEFFDFLMCIRNYINIECPVRIPSKPCKEQAEFFKDCGQYFYRR